MFPCWTKPPSGSSLSRSARAVRIRAAGGFARLGSGLGALERTAQENKSLHLKSLPRRGPCSQLIASAACRLALSPATLGELFRSVD